MSGATVFIGGHQDGWMGLDVALLIDDARDSVTLELYLPVVQGENQHKAVVVTDGVSLRHVLVQRGEKTSVEIPLHEPAPRTCVRILSASPEPASERDQRELAVVLCGLSTGARAALEVKVDETGQDELLALLPQLPGFWPIQRSFDAEHYLSQLKGRPIHHPPALHYLAFGWRENLVPNSEFDPDFYISQVPYLAGSDICPFAHYEQTGRPAGLLANRSQAVNWAEKAQAERVYIDKHWKDCVRLLLSSIGADSSFLNDALFSQYVVHLFDAEHYRNSRGLAADLTATELLARYLLLDYPRGTPPGPLFDEEHYLAQIARRRETLLPGETPFKHWLRCGVANQISPTPLFEAKEYLRLNADLKSYPNWVFEHWIAHGLRENRAYDRNFRVTPEPGKGAGVGQPQSATERFTRRIARDATAVAAVHGMRRFRQSETFSGLVAHAARLDPNVGKVAANLPSLMAPLYDGYYASFKSLLALLPPGPFQHVVLVPFCKLGGADFVAGLLAQSLAETGETVLVLRTDQSAWERPDWFPADVAAVDLSGALQGLPETLRQRMLYELLRHIRPRNVFNVNSRLAFDTMERFGERMRCFTRLHCYYFCADHTEDGLETGYPVWFFANLLPHLSSALIDSLSLVRTLTQRYALPAAQAEKLHVAYTPAKQPAPVRAVVELQVASAPRRPRPVILWAGRLDRQKRFELLAEIARAMPDVDFHCWGKAVLDKAPDTSALPGNLQLHGPFAAYEELPLADCDGWLYTSAWDGIPTILIECAQMGMPIVASAVGGVPELINERTGWPLAATASTRDYVAALRHMLADPERRVQRARALQAHAAAQHDTEAYKDLIRRVAQDAAAADGSLSHITRYVSTALLS